MTIETDILDKQIKRIEAQIELNLANVAFNNMRLSKQITDIQAKIDAAKEPVV